MTINEITSSIINDIYSGLRGLHRTLTLSVEQIEDEVIQEWQSILKELYYKGILPRKDVMLAINCIEVDCEYMARCCDLKIGQKSLHFEIPQLVNDLGNYAIEFIGSVDRQEQYVIYTDTSYQFHKYKKRNADKPYVYIETTPNENNMYDGFIFNVPFVKYISVIGIFKDPRQLEKYSCCTSDSYLSITSYIAKEIQERLTKRKLYYYRVNAAQVLPNDGVPV